MALIKCIECGKEISDKATACPNCGCLAKYLKQAQILVDCMIASVKIDGQGSAHNDIVAVYVDGAKIISISAWGGQVPMEGVSISVMVSAGHKYRLIVNHGVLQLVETNNF